MEFCADLRARATRADRLFACGRRLFLGLLMLAAIADHTLAIPLIRADKSEPASQELYDSLTREVPFDGEIPGFLSAQPISGDTLYVLCNEGEYQFGTGAGGSDCWGYEAGGIAYALMGMAHGVVFIDVTNGDIIDTVLGPGCGWRDMVTAGSYAYGVSECGDGLTVMDLQFLPDSVHKISNLPTDGSSYWWSHNMCVDSVAGYIYIEGWGGSGWTNTNIFIHDISDPANPTFVTGFSSVGNDIHDMYASGDTVYIANGSVSSYSIWDVSEKFNPQELAVWVTPTGGYAHNIWPTEDRTHVVTTEETGGRTVKVWNVEDPFNIQLVGEYLGPGLLAHNAHVKGDKIYISHYESGLRVIDISDPTDPFEIGAFDTHPNENPNFAGAWGAFPFSPSGYIYVSNMNERLYVLREKIAVINDTMVIETVPGTPGSDVRVDVYASNSQEARQFLIPISWAGPGDLTWDSVSTAGLRTSYFEHVDLVKYNPIGKDGAWSVTSSLSGTSPDLAPGSGPVLSLYFSIGGSASDGLSPVKFRQINDAVPTIFDNCALNITPDTTSGGVIVSGSCCNIAGDADNSGSVNIGDVTFLIARIFSGGAAPLCCEQADVDFGGTVSIGDVTYLIAHIFGGGPNPICGPVGVSCGAP